MTSVNMTSVLDDINERLKHAEQVYEKLGSDDTVMLATDSYVVRVPYIEEISKLLDRSEVKTGLAKYEGSKHGEGIVESDLFSQIEAEIEELAHSGIELLCTPTKFLYESDQGFARILRCSDDALRGVLLEATDLLLGENGDALDAYMWFGITDSNLLYATRGEAREWEIVVERVKVLDILPELEAGSAEPPSAPTLNKSEIKDMLQQLAEIGFQPVAADDWPEAVDETPRLTLVQPEREEDEPAIEEDDDPEYDDCSQCQELVDPTTLDEDGLCQDCAEDAAHQAQTEWEEAQDIAEPEPEEDEKEAEILVPQVSGRRFGGIKRPS